MSRFWQWYNRHHLLNLSVATGLFLLQIFHLYWLFTDVVLRRLVGRSFFVFPQSWWPVYTLIDYTEIPALITTSLVYIHLLRPAPFRPKGGGLREKKSVRAWLALGAINIQWVHLFWLTDEIVIDTFFGGHFLLWPAAVAWIAIGIDYLELPVIFDTAKRLILEIRRKFKAQDESRSKV